MNSQVRAIAYNCFENLGTYPIEEFKNSLKDLDPESKLQLSKLGIRVGAKFFFMPNFMKKKTNWTKCCTLENILSSRY